MAAIIRVTTEALDPRWLDEVFSPDAGAVVTFAGSVRSATDGKSVESLEYEAYEEMALRQLREIAEHVERTWPITGVFIAHRTGLLHAGEVTVLIGVSAPHRDSAFQACRYCIETLKQVAAIWKKERFTDGEVRWVNHP